MTFLSIFLQSKAQNEQDTPLKEEPMVIDSSSEDEKPAPKKKPPPPSETEKPVPTQPVSQSGRAQRAAKPAVGKKRVRAESDNEEEGDEYKPEAKPRAQKKGKSVIDESEESELSPSPESKPEAKSVQKTRTISKSPAKAAPRKPAPSKLTPKGPGPYLKSTNYFARAMTDHETSESVRRRRRTEHQYR